MSVLYMGVPYPRPNDWYRSVRRVFPPPVPLKRDGGVAIC
jgi:hypothetical protein